MGLVVVRCPACRGASQVEAGAVGLTVRCPHCAVTFEAVEEIEMVIPARAPRNPTLPAPRTERNNRGERHRRRKPRREREREPETPPEPDHDPHRIPPGPLPVSVLIGLALLPFAIPVLWLVGPALIGEPPVLSIATPIALAVSASILCLAVIYTIDWTPATRVKGVLMLVCVTYFAAMNLYFLKKEMVDRVKKVTGEEGIDWKTYHRKAGDYDIRMPGLPKPVKKNPMPDYKLECFTSTHIIPFQGSYAFTAGAAPVGIDPFVGTKKWFNGVEEGWRQQYGSLKSEVVKHKDYLGRQFVIELRDSNRVRVIRLFVINGYLYYLSVEGDSLDPDDDPARVFFESFNCRKAKD